jgi:hypothetical protein
MRSIMLLLAFSAPLPSRSTHRRRRQHRRSQGGSGRAITAYRAKLAVARDRRGRLGTATINRARGVARVSDLFTVNDELEGSC